MRRLVWICRGLVFLIVGSMLIYAAAEGQPPPPQPSPDQGPAATTPDQGAPSPAPKQGAAATTTSPAGVDVLTRGPLHEAFAEPTSLAGAVGPVIPKRPPSTINENPADYRPDADGAAWIPGYWGWDQQAKDFIWVTGVWRIPPPGMQWIAGYWVEAPGGFQWVPGFWTAAETNDINYYPQPPAPPDQGSPGDPPNPDDFWAPGCWNWQNNQFVWTNGYWTTGRPGWVWSPTCYSWTPRGFVRIAGYWDYALGNRGLAFAPLAISPSVYQAAGFSYTPSVAIDPNVLSFYLFTCPAWSQYCFGDYFSPECEQAGIYPWYQVNHFRNYRYDPLFAYDNWYYRTRDPQWVRNLDYWNRYYRTHPEMRPPRDLAAERRLAARHPNRPDFAMQMIGQPLSNLVHSSALPFHLARLNAAERTRAIDVARSNRAFESERSRLETAGRAAAGRAGSRGAVATAMRPEKLTLPRREHAIVGPRAAPRAEITQAPPRRPAIEPAREHREVMKPIVPENRSGPESRANEPPRIAPKPEVRRPEPSPVEPKPDVRRPEPQVNREAPRQTEKPRPAAEVRPEARHPRAPNFEPAHKDPPRPAEHPAPARHDQPPKKP